MFDAIKNVIAKFFGRKKSVIPNTLYSDNKNTMVINTKKTEPVLTNPGSFNINTTDSVWSNTSSFKSNTPEYQDLIRRNRELEEDRRKTRDENERLERERRNREDDDYRRRNGLYPYETNSGSSGIGEFIAGVAIGSMLNSGHSEAKHSKQQHYTDEMVSKTPKEDVKSSSDSFEREWNNDVDTTPSKTVSSSFDRDWDRDTSISSSTSSWSSDTSSGSDSSWGSDD